LLHPQLFEIIEYVASRGIELYVTTNGTLLTDENIKKILNSKLKRITISLDRADEIYEKIRKFDYKKTKKY